MGESRYADLDDLELEAVGYKREMPRQFSLLSLGALSFTLTCTWLGTGSSVGISLTEASPAGAIWALPIAGFMTCIVSLGMAELASAYPVAGAQYYWSFMVAREDSITSLWYPDYEIRHWQQWLIYVLLLWLAISLNIFASNLIPLWNQMIFVLSVLVLSATTIALFVCSRNSHAASSWIFADTTNSTGWSSDGFAFILSVSNAVYAFLGSDAGAHLCEEIPNPGRNVPKVIIFPLIVGLITAFPFACACMFSIIDLDSVLTTATGLPLIEIYYQGTGSKAAASFLMALFAFCFFGCLVATTSSRALWAVSRDGAFPFSRLWSRVNRRFKMPMNAMILSGTCISLYGLIFLGSSTAFSAMVRAAIIFLQTSYIIPQAILLYRGRDKVLPERYFSLGIFGPAINLISILWVVFLDIVYCFPTAKPLKKENMNYTSVVCCGLVLFVVGLWYTSKKEKFTGPKIDMAQLTERRLVGIKGGLTEGVVRERLNLRAT
ncbi:hypothetical protein G7Y89_g15538 [Cudoniella acicularis]|uniref:Amino acid transporter n=1 Tax=Cudoniella acicularis TaxID=354080 RepID=A0A8H4VJ48_9HELO|nr:hypothetical protein G7Y89_g15538 [Cudoniella acicularis]